MNRKQLMDKHQPEMVPLMGHETSDYRCDGCFQPWPCDANLILTAWEADRAVMRGMLERLWSLAK